MTATDTMRWMGRSARSRAGAMGHAMRDRALDKRLERTSEETDRLRLENDALRGEVDRARSEHDRLLEMLDARLDEPPEGRERSHRGRWLLILMAFAGGAYTWLRMRAREPEREWIGAGDDGARSGMPTG